jgi:hypothetical protein
MEAHTRSKAMTKQVVTAKNNAASAKKTMSYMEHLSGESEPLRLDQRIEQVREQREQQNTTGHNHDGARMSWAWRMANYLVE